MTNITFEKATVAHKDTIFQWLDKPHMKEFWDNSVEHRDDIVIFMVGRKEKSPYFDGIFSYWVGLIDKEPYCLILTAEAKMGDEMPAIWAKHLSKTGNTYSLDFGIGNEEYLGKGLAAPTLDTFTKYFQDQIDEKADTFFIDPDDNNPRAQHVYAKAGFKMVGEFVMEGRYHQFSGDKTYLKVKKLSVTKQL